jgi:hypothetical protein
MRTSGARFPDPDDKPLPLKRYSIALPVTTMHYVTVDAADEEEAEKLAIATWKNGGDMDTGRPTIDFDDINVKECES